MFSVCSFILESVGALVPRARARCCIIVISVCFQAGFGRIRFCRFWSDGKKHKIRRDRVRRMWKLMSLWVLIFPLPPEHQRFPVYFFNGPHATRRFMFTDNDNNDDFCFTYKAFNADMKQFLLKSQHVLLFHHLKNSRFELIHNSSFVKWVFSLLDSI